MARVKRQSNTILAILLALVVGLGIFGFVSLFKKVDNLELTKTVSSSAYARGLLSDTTGKLPQDSADIDYSGIHMKEFIIVDGLKCELMDNAKVKYTINYFDEDYQFIGVSEKKAADYNSAEDEELQADGVFEGAKFALIEIMPTADADGIVSSSEVKGYAKQLIVTYNK